MDKDYSSVIDAEDYTQGLAEHVDIPQSDAGIIRIITDKARATGDNEFRVLDLGCGPGRLTKPIAMALEDLNRTDLTEVIGLDVSEGFIKYATENKAHKLASYLLTDFLTHDFGDTHFDAILMQGLFHHVPLNLREEWLAKCKTILSYKGVVVIGDEFVPDYKDEDGRIRNVVGLYAYVIASALRSGHISLAEIESMNMVDDVSAGTSGAGHSDAELIKEIQERSEKIYSSVFESGVRMPELRRFLEDTAKRIHIRSEEIAQSDTANHNRGDYKISIEKQEEQLASSGFKLIDIKKYGPVDWLGGMGVLVFTA